MTDAREVHFLGGEHIRSAAERLIEAGVGAYGTFNDIVIRNDDGSTAESIVAAFDRDSEAVAAAWRTSPAGIEAARQREERRQAMQARGDALMAALPDLDWSDDHAVLRWITDMQDPSDHAGVRTNAPLILRVFIEHGYEPNAYVDDAFVPGDRRIEHAWLIGQALDGLRQIGAIHGVVHSFAEKWRAQFPGRALAQAETGEG